MNTNLTRSEAMRTKSFELRVLLSSTTGKLLTDIGDICKLLGWMTNDEPMTHQLPRFNQECKPWLLRWFPDLTAVNDELPRLEELLLVGDNKKAACEQWLLEIRELVPSLQDSYDVHRIPRDDHEQKDAYDELIAMRGTDEGVVIVETPPCNS